VHHYHLLGLLIRSVNYTLLRPGIKTLNCHEYKLLNAIQNCNDESIGCALLGILTDKYSQQDRCFRGWRNRSCSYFYYWWRISTI